MPISLCSSRSPGWYLLLIALLLIACSSAKTPPEATAPVAPAQEGDNCGFA